MNLLDNASFEASSSWVASERGAFVAVPAADAYDGAAVAQLIGGTTPGGEDYSGSLTQYVSRAPVVFYAAVWCKQLTVDAPAVVLSVVEGGSVRELARLEPDAIDQWNLLAATFQAAEAVSAFVVSVADSAAGAHAGQWQIDAAEFSEVTNMAHGCSAAYVALVERLGTISGSADGYYHAPAPVIPRFLRPADPGAPPAPYICCSLEDDGPYTQFEGDCVRLQLRVAVYVMLPETISDDAETSAAADALDWHDDVLKCLMPNDQSSPWTITGESSESIDVLEKSVRAFQPDGIGPHVRILVGLNLSFARADLGTEA